MIRLSVIIALALVVSACSDEPSETKVDTTLTGTPQPMEAPRDTGFNPVNVESFEEVVYKQYARLAVSLPRRVMDSILETTTPLEIDEQMTKHLHAQDTAARGQLAAKYGITRDSVDAILARHNVPKR